MKRLVYLAVLSMAIMVVAAPAALAQQGNGLCSGASAVETFSGTTSVDETAPFNISTETFQVAVELTPTNNSEFASASVFVGDSNFTTLTSEFFTTDNLSGVIPVDNNGAGPFTLSILPDEASYDITVFECPNGGTTVEPPTTTTPGTTMMVEPPTTTTPGTTMMVETTEDVGGVQYEEETTEDTEGMTALPDTGGSSLMLLSTALFAGAGILGFALLRRRSE
jgi:LPXTG-motif cell wall-anchored protein